MTDHKTPQMSKELFDRIRLVRRDFGDLLFHFTRAAKERFLTIQRGHGGTMSIPSSASGVLSKILHEGNLTGTSKWTHGTKCVCFTEAPIQEFGSIFSLVEIASSKRERPRYEPYGIAVSKKWLFERGGRPVIYEDPNSFDEFPEDLKYRFVPYNPGEGIDFTWEREWRIRIESLKLDPKETLVVVPTSDEAFDFVYEFADIEADYDDSEIPEMGSGL